MTSRPKILLVDDREANLLALSTLLEPHDAHLLTAGSGVEALELLLVHDVALALLDVEMPGMDGYEIAQLMRGAERTRDIPIMFITAAGFERAREFKGYDVGAVDFLVKPLEPRFLDNKVRTFLRLHRQKEELADAKRRLQAVMDAAPVGVIFSDDATCERVTGNPTALAQFDASRDDNLSASAMEIDSCGRGVRFRSGSRELAGDELPLNRAVAEGKDVGPVEVEVCLRGGRSWFAQVSAAPLRDECGRVAGAVAVTVDITERKRLEEALRASGQRFRAMADSMPQLVWTAQANGAIDYYNARAAEYAGILRMPDGSWSADPAMHPDDAARADEAWRRALASQEPFVCEHRIKTADGSYRWHLSRANPVRDAVTGELKWFGTTTDIHAQKHVEQLLRENERRLGVALEAAEQAVRGRDQLVSVVSHDLKNPLAAIVMQAELLRQKLLSGQHGESIPGLEAGLSRIERQAARMAKLIAELLDAARLQAGSPLTLERHSADLVTLVRQVADEHQRLSSTHTIDLRARVPALEGVWDHARLERVVHNLLSNAIKYSPGGGTVGVTIDRVCVDGVDFAQVSVVDRGVGIPEEDRERVFEWFTRGANVERSMIQGTGIGLAGSRQIVELHGGSISVESKQGEGSTFTVTLPLAPPDEAIDSMHVDNGHAEPLRLEGPSVVEGAIQVSPVDEDRPYSALVQASSTDPGADRDEFLSVASHELRTPLTTLGLQLEALKRQIDQESNGAQARYAKKVDVALRQTERLAVIVEALLDASRIVSGNLELNFDRFDLRVLVEEVAEVIRDSAERAGSSINVAAGEPVFGAWDRLRIQRVVANLMRNAVKYGAGAPIEVAVEARGSTAEVRVHDHGIGLCEADKARIFERFERAVSSAHYGGLGVGLYVTRGIVQAHGGAVFATGAPGKGATFIVHLPMDGRLAKGKSGIRPTDSGGDARR